MPNRWMDERGRRWRERFRPHEADQRHDDDEAYREARSFSADDHPERDHEPGDREARGYGDAPRDRYRRRPANRDGRFAGAFYGYDLPRPPGADHSYFGFGHDIRGSEYEIARERAEREASYTPNVREGRGEGGRNWWDRTRDEVTSWFGDHDAERRRRWDAQNSQRGRGPKGYRRSDERVLEEAQDRLTEDHWLDASEIEVTVAAGELTLSGFVTSRTAKHRAEILVEEISGVDHVQNNLRVGLGGRPGGL